MCGVFVKNVFATTLPWRDWIWGRKFAVGSCSLGVSLGSRSNCRFSLMAWRTEASVSRTGMSKRGGAMIVVVNFPILDFDLGLDRGFEVGGRW